MEQQPLPNNSKRNLIVIIVALAIAILFYRYLNDKNFSQTSFLFVGIPALISIVLVKFTKATSGFGIMFKVVTLFLLISGMFLGEGIACILFAAPIFYLVGAILVAISDYLNRRDKEKLYIWTIIPVLLIMGEAGDFKKVPQLQTVEVTQTYKGDISLEQLNQHNILKNKLPYFFKLGFPTPVSMKGTGIEVSAERQIDFDSQTKGIGSLVLEVTESTPNKIVFRNKSDNSHIHRWLDWREVEVTLFKNGNNTKVTWKSDYYCELEPSWYFEPIERFAVQKSSRYLLDAYFNLDDGAPSTH